MKTILNVLDTYLSKFFVQLEKHSLIDSYLFLRQSNEQTAKKLRPIWSNSLDAMMKKSNTLVMNEDAADIPLVFDLHLPCAMLEYEVIRQIRQTVAQTRENDNENLTDFAIKQLVSTSVHGQFINQILENKDLFDHYYHDQLTLIRNEGNICYLSTSFVQRLLSLNVEETGKDRLRHLFVGYEELIEIMKLFEISVLLLGDEKIILQRLDQQLVNGDDDVPKSMRKDIGFYR